VKPRRQQQAATIPCGSSAAERARDKLTGKFHREAKTGGQMKLLEETAVGQGAFSAEFPFGRPWVRVDPREATLNLKLCSV
jgi:hypothetical protein